MVDAVHDALWKNDLDATVKSHLERLLVASGAVAMAAGCAHVVGGSGGDVCRYVDAPVGTSIRSMKAIVFSNKFDLIGLSSDECKTFALPLRTDRVSTSQSAAFHRVLLSDLRSRKVTAKFDGVVLRSEATGRVYFMASRIVDVQTIDDPGFVPGEAYVPRFQAR